MNQSLHVLRLPLWSSFFTRCFLLSTATFFAWFGLVWDERQNFCSCSNDFLHAFLLFLCSVPAAFILG
jgi:hypothetical protein